MSKASKRARELCATATEGPWHIMGEHGNAVENLDDVFICQVENCNGDPDFIAESRTLLAQLADEVERLEARNNELRQAVVYSRSQYAIKMQSLDDYINEVLAKGE